MSKVVGKINDKKTYITDIIQMSDGYYLYCPECKTRIKL